jgi:hypothetical protein
MEQYNDAARPFWLESWNGGPYRVDRIKHPEQIQIAHLAVAWFGGVQPERLVGLMAEPDDGLLARFVWCWPEPIPFARSQATHDNGFALTALDRLRLLEMGRGFAGNAEPVLVPLAGRAQDRLVAFGQTMQQQRDQATGLLRSAIGKARGIALRVSLVLEYLWWCSRDGFDPPPATISDAALEAATLWVVDYALPMAERTYGDAGISPAERNVTALARWIARTRPTEVHIRTLRRQVRLPGLTEAPAVREAAGELVELGWLLPPATPTSAGRPRAAFLVNPRLWEVLT